jgi:DNA-binding LacI/PurR family transcriptional regulator
MSNVIKYKWEQIKIDIIRKIASGEYQEGDKLPSEREFQGIYSVSRVCIRQVLDKLEHDTIITRLPGKGAFVGGKQALPVECRKKSRLIALTTLGGASDMSTFKLLDGIRAVVSKKNYHMVVEPIPDDPECEKEVINTLIGKGIDGFILTGTSARKQYGQMVINKNTYKELTRKKVPFVMADRLVSSTEWSCVSYQVEEPVTEIVNQLVKNGKRHIAYVGLDFSITGDRRYRAYLNAMRSVGLEVNDKLTALCHEKKNKKRENFNPIEWGRYAARELLLCEEKFDAVVTFSDMVAYGVFQGLQYSNISLHGKFMGGLEHLYVQDQAFQKSLITSVSKPLYEIGKSAGTLILDELESHGECAKITELLPMPLIHNEAHNIETALASNW